MWRSTNLPTTTLKRLAARADAMWKGKEKKQPKISPPFARPWKQQWDLLHSFPSPQFNTTHKQSLLQRTVSQISGHSQIMCLHGSAQLSCIHFPFPRLTLRALPDSGWALRIWAFAISTLTSQGLDTEMAPALPFCPQQRWSRDCRKGLSSPGLRSAPVPVLTFLYDNCCSFQLLHILCQLFLMPIFKEKSRLSVKLEDKDAVRNTV